jgi:hypothetical protein
MGLAGVQFLHDEEKGFAHKANLKPIGGFTQPTLGRGVKPDYSAMARGPKKPKNTGMLRYVLASNVSALF